MQTLPINFILNNRLVLVVGGGAIAWQKVDVLKRNGASVRVVAPAILQEIRDCKPDEILNRPFTEKDLDGIDLVIAATDRMRLNSKIRELAHQRGLLVNVVDIPVLCDFIFPSILSRGPLRVSVSTGGTGPALARMLRQELESLYPAATGMLLEHLEQMRTETRRHTICPGARRAIAECLSRRVMKGRNDDVVLLMDEMREIVETLPVAIANEQRCRSALNRKLGLWTDGIMEKVS